MPYFDRFADAEPDLLNTREEDEILDGLYGRKPRLDDETPLDSLPSPTQPFASLPFVTDTPVDGDGGDDTPGFVDNGSSISTVISTSSRPIPSVTLPSIRPASTTSPSVSPTPTSSIVPINNAASSVSIAPAATQALGKANGETSHKSGATSAAIGVTVTIGLLLLCALAFFFVRKRNIDSRKRRRSTWNPPSLSPRAANFDDLEASDNRRDDGTFENIDIEEKDGAKPLPNNFTFKSLPPLDIPALTAPGPLHPSGVAPPRMPSPPPVNAPSAADAPSPIGFATPALGGGNAPLITSTPFSATNGRSAAGNIVVVARTFLPTLPDELSIQTGEQIRLLTQYDDGWAHVERMKSGAGVESGVVPIECLEPIATSAAQFGAGFTQEAVEGWRLSKRKSSLQPLGPVAY
ncbi:hypothetical protein FRB99_007109 [Tulasnella sp. 403]|nr:hypothetical protein FRB99_007109 [Tulasnella sp. 403]